MLMIMIIMIRLCAYDYDYYDKIIQDYFIGNFNEQIQIHYTNSSVIL